jgi:hypothetical protein
MFFFKSIYTSDIALPSSTNFACLRPRKCTRLQFCTSMRLWEQGLAHRGQNWGIKFWPCLKSNLSLRLIWLISRSCSNELFCLVIKGASLLHGWSLSFDFCRKCKAWQCLHADPGSLSRPEDTHCHPRVSVLKKFRLNDCTNLHS